MAFIRTIPGVFSSKEADRLKAPSDGMCQVCTVVSFQFHHFGAFVCNRCRAFFRRTVRRSRKGGTFFNCIITKQPLEDKTPICDITLFRGACQACRYAKCLNVGMLPDSVLTDAARVRKYQKNRDLGDQDNDEDNFVDEEDDELELPRKRKPIRKGRGESKKGKNGGNSGPKKGKSAKVVGAIKSEKIVSNPLFELKILDSDLNPNQESQVLQVDSKQFNVLNNANNNPPKMIRNLEELKAVTYPFIAQPAGFFYDRPRDHPPWLHPYEETAISNFNFAPELINSELPSVCLDADENQDFSSLFGDILDNDTEEIITGDPVSFAFSSIDDINQANDIDNIASIGLSMNGLSSIPTLDKTGTNFTPFDMPDIFGES